MQFLNLKKRDNLLIKLLQLNLKKIKAILTISSSLFKCNNINENIMNEKKMIKKFDLLSHLSFIKLIHSFNSAFKNLKH